MRTFFAILSLGRSGSTFLVRLLDSHPRITCLGEVFAQPGVYPAGSGRDAAFFIESRLFGEKPGVLGFKFPWLNVRENPGVLDALWILDFRLIYLRRRNKVDHYLSVALAKRHNIWGPQGGAYPEQTIALDPDHMLDRFHYWSWVDEQFQVMCQGFSTITVEYEDLIRGVGHREI